MLFVDLFLVVRWPFIVWFLILSVWSSCVLAFVCWFHLLVDTGMILFVDLVSWSCFFFNLVWWWWSRLLIDMISLLAAFLVWLDSKFNGVNITSEHVSKSKALFFLPSCHLFGSSARRVASASKCNVYRIYPRVFRPFEGTQGKLCSECTRKRPKTPGVYGRLPCACLSLCTSEWSKTPGVYTPLWKITV